MLLAAALALLFASPAWAAEIARGPFLQQPSPTGMMVAWRFDAEAAGEVRYGSLGGALDKSAASPSAVNHRVQLTGLAPGGDYQYQVYSGGEAKSEVFSFRTAPNPGEGFRFAILGDTRSGHVQHQTLVDLMAREEFDFYLNSGDLVSDGETSDLWDVFFEIEAALLRQHAFFPTIGNHDEEEDGTAGNYVASFEVSPASSGVEEYYSFDYGNVHFTVVDGFVHVNSNWLCPDLLFLEECLNGEQQAWLEADLAAAQANAAIDHIIVMTHMGPYSSKEGRNGWGAMRNLMPLFQQYGVDLVLSGHDHYYERGVSGNGIRYMVSGGGGAGLYDCNSPNTWLYPHSVDFSRMVYHYVLVEVAGSLMTFIAKDIDGNEIDSFEIGTPPACTEDADCAGPPGGSCEGSWKCNHFECAWVCDPGQSCESAEDCTRPPPDPCEDGHWECPPQRICQWVCPSQPECQTDEDCRDKPAYDDCPGGYYICEDKICDWMCPSPDGDNADGDEDAASDGDVPIDGDDAVCVAGARRCEGNVVVRCLDDGSGWVRVESCGALECRDGACVTAGEDGDRPTPTIFTFSPSIISAIIAVTSAWPMSIAA